ncbi:hypothetical protein AsAng_0036200 [Aureispira anguillae]|uniref:Uncharacterized protein n=1 Tax=Aureispira anguillae TaxID=2864201 RepID=A0A916DUW6_9BACT|nr:hypothetical protein AsAng_0036200 [Aureispira anguillae]
MCFSAFKIAEFPTKNLIKILSLQGKSFLLTSNSQLGAIRYRTQGL